MLGAISVLKKQFWLFDLVSFCQEQILRLNVVNIHTTSIKEISRDKENSIAKQIFFYYNVVNFSTLTKGAIKLTDKHAVICLISRWERFVGKIWFSELLEISS